MADRIQLRGDTEANWISVNPILADREIGIAKDVGKAKVGDGVSTWTALPYTLSFEDPTLFPNATGNADKFTQVNSTGDGWLAQTAAEHRAAQGLGSAAVADILGTVSQASGIPTGAIIERGSNANGEYVKFADGTLICTHQMSGGFSVGAYASVANLYIGSPGTWTYPAPFAAGPRISGIGGDQSRVGWIGLTSIGASSAAIFYIAGSSSVTASGINLIAVGRWF